MIAVSPRELKKAIETNGELPYMLGMPPKGSHVPPQTPVPADIQAAWLALPDKQKYMPSGVYTVTDKFEVPHREDFIRAVPEPKAQLADAAAQRPFNQESIKDRDFMRQVITNMLDRLSVQQASIAATLPPSDDQVAMADENAINHQHSQSAEAEALISSGFGDAAVGEEQKAAAVAASSVPTQSTVGAASSEGDSIAGVINIVSEGVRAADALSRNRTGSATVATSSSATASSSSIAAPSTYPPIPEAVLRSLESPSLLARAVQVQHNLSTNIRNLLGLGSSGSSSSLASVVTLSPLQSGTVSVRGILRIGMEDTPGREPSSDT
jgi:hypothetical protein